MERRIRLQADGNIALCRVYLAISSIFKIISVRWLHVAIQHAIYNIAVQYSTRPADSSMDTLTIPNTQPVFGHQIAPADMTSSSLQISATFTKSASECNNDDIINLKEKRSNQTKTTIKRNRLLLFDIQQPVVSRCSRFCC